MSGLISRQAAIDEMAELQGRASTKAELTGIHKAWKRIKALPAADVVSREVFYQVQWERDVAIQQLKELGYGIGEKIHHCHDCRYNEVTNPNSANIICGKYYGAGWYDGYCSDWEDK